MSLKEKFVGISGTLAGATSVLGSYQVCHNVCLGIILVLSIIGISVAGMPLMFLTKVAVPFWIAGAVLLATTFLMTKYYSMHFQKSLILANAGLLIAGAPFKQIQAYQTTLWVIGGLIIAVSIILAVKSRGKKCGHR